MRDFDVAVSFAGEDRSSAKTLAEILSSSGIRVFYDDYEQANLLGENLTEYLIDIYKNKASFCVVFVSCHYVEKRWTRHEWRAAQARAFEEFNRTYIIPIRLDSSELPGLLSTVGYLSKNKGETDDRFLSRVAGAVVEKVKSQSGLNAIIRIAHATYQRGSYKQANDLLRELLPEPGFIEDVEAVRLLAHSHNAIGQHREAVELFEKVSARIPDDPELYFLRGTCLFRLGRFAEAERMYLECLARHPGHFTANLDLTVLKRLRWLSWIPFSKRFIVFLHPQRTAQLQSRSPSDA